jgi:hypothetical protein
MFCQRRLIIGLSLFASVGLATPPSRAALSTKAPATTQPILPADWTSMTLTELDGFVREINIRVPKRVNLSIRQSVDVAIWNQYLFDDAHLSQTWQRDQHATISLIDDVITDMPFDRSYALRPRLVKYISNPVVLRELTYEDWLPLYQTFRFLRVPPVQLEPLISQWLTTSPHAQGLDGVGVVDFAQMLSDCGVPDAQTALHMLAAKAWSMFMGDSRFIENGNLTLLNRAFVSLSPMLEPQRREFLANELTDRFLHSPVALADVNLRTASEIVRSLRTLGASDGQVANVVCEWAIARDQRSCFALDDRDPIWQSEDFSPLVQRAIEPAAFADMIQQQLTRDDAAPGPSAGKLLGVVATINGSTDRWRATLDSKENLASTTGDEKACWCLARANAMEVRDGQPQPTSDGAAFAKRALQCGVTDRVRFAATEWLARDAEAANDNEQGQTLIQQSIEACNDPAVIHQLYVLSEQLTVYSRMMEGVQSHIQEKQEIQLKGQLAALEAQLDRARQLKRPGDEIVGLQSLISNTERQLTPGPTTAPVNADGPRASVDR